MGGEYLVSVENGATEGQYIVGTNEHKARAQKFDSIEAAVATYRKAEDAATRFNMHLAIIEL